MISDRYEQLINIYIQFCFEIKKLSTVHVYTLNILGTEYYESVGVNNRKSKSVLLELRYL